MRRRSERPAPVQRCLRPESGDASWREASKPLSGGGSETLRRLHTGVSRGGESFPVM